MWKVFVIHFLIIYEYSLQVDNVIKKETQNTILKEQAQVRSYSPYSMIMAWLLIF